MRNGGPPAGATLALWSPNLNTPLASLDEWLERVEERLGESARAGARLLVLPEHAVIAWLQFAPPLETIEEPGWIARQARRAVPALRDMVQRHGVGLVPGSIPYRPHDRGGLVNRAFMITPEGRICHHDKLELTPSERSAGCWQLERGSDVRVCEWRGLRIATLICLDVQLTRVIAGLAQLDVDLLLVPSATNDVAGYHRVFDCAKARAVELQCAVAIVGLMGRTHDESFVGGAAVYLPCEPSLGESGVAASAGPFSAETTGDHFLLVPDLPFEDCRRIRQGAAEAQVQPARWSGQHLRFAVEPH